MMIVLISQQDAMGERIRQSLMESQCSLDCRMMQKYTGIPFILIVAIYILPFPQRKMPFGIGLQKIDPAPQKILRWSKYLLLNG